MQALHKNTLLSMQAHAADEHGHKPPLRVLRQNQKTNNFRLLSECESFRMQYMGQSETAFRLRFNNHKAHTKSFANLLLSKHLSLPNHSFKKLSVTLREGDFFLCFPSAFFWGECVVCGLLEPSADPSTAGSGDKGRKREASVPRAGCKKLS